MSFRRFRRSQPGPQAVHVPGVSQPVVFSDGGEPSSHALTRSVAPRPLVHRSLDDLLNMGRPFFWSGYGADQPHDVVRRSLRLPVGPVVGPRRVVRSPSASNRRIANSWRAFNTLAVAQRVSFCVRRKSRREVLFAFRVAGRRGLGKRGVRRTVNSQYRCL